MRTVLVFDTETTGLPDFKAPAHAEHQPHIVQLAWKVYHDGVCVISESTLIDSNHESHPNAERVHRKTMKIRKHFGVPIDHALNRLFEDAIVSDLIVAHNRQFDMRMIAREAYHLYPQDEKVTPWSTFNAKDGYCTMMNSTNICRIPGPRGFKWPKLDEAYRHLVDPAGFAGAHDAMVDVEACAKVYFELQKRKFKATLNANL